MMSAEMLKKATARADKIAQKRTKEVELMKRKEFEKEATLIVTKVEKALEEYYKKGYKEIYTNKICVCAFDFYDDDDSPVFLIVKKYFEKKDFTVSLELKLVHGWFYAYHGLLCIAW